MVFNSFQFVLFFVAVLVVYFGLPHRLRWMFLLPASYYFYMCWKPEFIVLLLATTGVDYALARLIAASTSPGWKRAWLAVSC
jgi:D-alanyl-lipoteichoic acid acyltransferase DltB (MBOAT superfamily)